MLLNELYFSQGTGGYNKCKRLLLSSKAHFQLVANYAGTFTAWGSAGFRFYKFWGHNKTLLNSNSTNNFEILPETNFKSSITSSAIIQNPYLEFVPITHLPLFLYCHHKLLTLLF